MLAALLAEGEIGMTANSSVVGRGEIGRVNTDDMCHPARCDLGGWNACGRNCLDYRRAVKYRCINADVSCDLSRCDL